MTSAEAAQRYYTTVNFPATQILVIKVDHGKVTTKTLGASGAACASLAMSRWGTLYGICGPLFGAQQLASIDLQTGHANLFGVPTPGLGVMSLAFAPDGSLYAVGDCNPDFKILECVPGKDPNFNSLYRVNVSTGAFTRIGATGAPQYFMDLAFDSHGHLYGVTTTLSPSYVPAILYRINTTTGAATPAATLIGSSQVMGIEFGEDDTLYGTDFMAVPGFYVIDPKTGFEKAIGALPVGFSSGLAGASDDPD